MPRAGCLPILPALTPLRGVCRRAGPISWRRLHASRDHRGRGRAGAAPEQLRLLVGAATTASTLQPLAIRALGRLERADLIDALLAMLDAGQPAARAEAAWALAQSAGSDVRSAARVREVLLQRLVGEPDAAVRGAIGEALGRLPLESPAVAGVSRTRWSRSSRASRSPAASTSSRQAAASSASP